MYWFDHSLFGAVGFDLENVEIVQHHQYDGDYVLEFGAKGGFGVGCMEKLDGKIEEGLESGRIGVDGHSEMKFGVVVHAHSEVRLVVGWCTEVAVHGGRS